MTGKATIVSITIALSSIIILSNSRGKLIKSSTNALSLIKHKKQINLYQYNKYPDIQNNTKKYLATFTVKTNTADLLSSLKNEAFAKQWIKSIKEYNHMTPASENCWYTYMLFNIPWPFNDQDCILKYSLLSCSDTSLHIKFESLPYHIPLNDKITRIKEFDGAWKFLKQTNSNTKAYFIMGSNTFTKNKIAESIILNTIVNSLATFREYSNEKVR